MKWLLIPILALNLSAAASTAEAKPHGYGGGRAERHFARDPGQPDWRAPQTRSRGNRRGAQASGWAGETYQLAYGKPDRRSRFEKRQNRANPGRGQGRGRGGYGRGAILAPEARGQRLVDYGRYRLRRPPPGYSYHLRGDRVFLVSDQTGMIFDVVPLR